MQQPSKSKCSNFALNSSTNDLRANRTVCRKMLIPICWDHMPWMHMMAKYVCVEFHTIHTANEENEMYCTRMGISAHAKHSVAFNVSGNMHGVQTIWPRGHQWKSTTHHQIKKKYSSNISQNRSEPKRQQRWPTANFCESSVESINRCRYFVRQCLIQCRCSSSLHLPKIFIIQPFT